MLAPGVGGGNVMEGKDMEERGFVERRLRELDAMRRAVAVTEQAMQLLTPEERLILDRLYIHPEVNHVQELCELLEVESATVYRRKNKAVEKLARVMIGSGWGGES